MKIQLVGFEDLQARMEALEKNSDEIAKKALYGGTGVVADSVKKRIESLPTEESRRLKDGEKFNVCTAEQRDAMASRFGVSPMEDKGDSIDALIGFDDAGYIGKSTRKLPHGLPVKMLARSINSGSSVREKIPFFRQAVTGSTKTAIQKEKQIASEEIEKILNEARSRMKG